METIDLRKAVLDRVVGAAGCWEWTRGRNAYGYGVLFWGGKLHAAHRLSYSAFNGEIPRGLSVCHTCDNPACANPDHLWLGTQKDNLTDAARKGRVNRAVGESSNTAVLNEAQVREIRALFRTGTWTKAALARLYRCTAMNIFAITSRKTWTHVND